MGSRLVSVSQATPLGRKLGIVFFAKTADIAPGSPWQNGYIESSNARLRDELLDGEIIYSLKEAQIVIESWRRHYNVLHLRFNHQ
jgi:hypothetical protein